MAFPPFTTLLANYIAGNGIILIENYVALLQIVVYEHFINFHNLDSDIGGIKSIYKAINTMQLQPCCQILVSNSTANTKILLKLEGIQNEKSTGGVTVYVVFA
jgi:hypothetical protein